MEGQAMEIPVVVAAYNRDTALERLLGSLLKARYDEPVKLILCIDGGGPPEVVRVAERFAWPHGEKEVIVQERNLGLRKHILFCGGLSSLYDGVIVLEDDLYVSPCYYQYALSAARYYRESPGISGIALYSPRFNECARLPFYPLDDGTDVFFMQAACSWGQLWLKRQWEEFATWYAENAGRALANDPALPCEIQQWPDSSWKKYFITFMVEQGNYFVYPRQSLTTNFGDLGSHHTGTLLYQVPLLYGEKKQFNFIDLAGSLVKYDIFGEILPGSLQQLCPQLREREFVVDLYGIKETHCYTSEFVLTSKKCNGAVATYGKYLLPVEANIVENIPGGDLSLTTPDRISDIEEQNFQTYIYTRCADIEEQKYFYNISDLHYFLLNKEIKKYKAVSEIAQKKAHELNKGIKKTRIELADTRKKLADAQKSLELVRKSTSFRIGNAIVLPLSCLKRKKRTCTE